MNPVPQPGPEHAKLGYFAGKWTSEADVKPSSLGPGGRITIQEDAKWMEGGYFLVVQLQFVSATLGNGSGVAIMGYNADEKLYTYDEFNSLGEAIHSTGNVAGDTWTWNGARRVGPQTLKTRLTMKLVSPSFYTYKFEVSPDGAKWDQVMEGKDTKNK